MSDPDEKIAIENMSFFLEGLARRFENEECPTLPKLCRAVATEIEHLQGELRIKSEFISTRQCPDHNGKWPRGRCLQCEIEQLDRIRRTAQEYMDRHGLPYETAARRMLRKELETFKKADVSG